MTNISYTEHLAIKNNILYENLYKKMCVKKLNYIEILSKNYDELYESLYKKMKSNTE